MNGGLTMRVKITTTIDENLLAQTKEIVKNEGLEGANAIIERALQLYFASTDEVWEKALESGWVKKVVIQQDRIHFENIKSRKIYCRYRKEDYTEEALLARGWQRVIETKA
jgi:metal-responsive CopG/Arc/MetJ family transcriptional regulator